MIVFRFDVQAPFLTSSTLGPDGTVTQPEVAVHGVDRPFMIHDFAITQRYVVLVVAPLVIDADAMLVGGNPIAWQPDLGTRIAVIPRDRAAPTRWVHTDAFWTWHYANAYEADDRIYLDFPWTTAPQLVSAADRAGAKAGFTRACLDPDHGTATLHHLDARGTEFPRIDDRLVGLPHRYVTTGSGGESMQFGEHDRIHQYDMVTGTSLTAELDMAVGEVQFAPRAGSTGELDGYYLAFATDLSGPRSFLVIWDAGEFPAPPIARIRIPTACPTGSTATGSRLTFDRRSEQQMNNQRVLFSDDFYDGQFVRTLAAAPSGLSDLGEAFATARTVGKHPTPQRWHAGWWARAVGAHERAKHAARAGHGVTARGAHLRASEYARQSYFFLRHDLADERLRAAHRLHVEAFRAAVELMDHPARRVAIPYDATTIKGYLFAPVADGRRRPTMLMPAGYDSTAESGWADVPAALQHGYNALVFEGPGQGASLYDDHLVFRADFEHVLTQVIDWLVGDASVDPEALVLCGRSFAGYLAPRAATVEHRVAALICDPAQPDLSARLPGGFIGKVAAPVVELQIRHDTDKAEFFGSRMAAHGVTTVAEYFDVLRTYTMLDDAPKISCPTLIIECEGDPVGGGGELLMDHLTCPATYVALTAADGAGGHCAGLGQRVWDDTVYPWLTEALDA